MENWNDFTSNVTNSFGQSSIDWGERSRTYDTDYNTWDQRYQDEISSTPASKGSGCGCLLLILLMIFGISTVLSSSKAAEPPLQSINLVTPIPNTPLSCYAEVVSAGLNIRSGPDLSFSVIDNTSLVKGMRVPVLAVDPQTRWLRVQLPNKEGWISPYYVKINCDP